MIERIALIGSCGAGKSTLARQLATITGLPVRHLDMLYWRAGWVEPAAAEWQRLHDRLVSEPRWIIDENFGSSLGARLARADLVVLLDLPTWLCVWRLARRIAGWYGRTRPDMADGCPERFDGAFLFYVIGFRWRVLPRTLARLEGYRGRLIRLRSSGEVRAFLDRVHVDPAGCGTALGNA